MEYGLGGRVTGTPKKHSVLRKLALGSAALAWVAYPYVQAGWIGRRWLESRESTPLQSRTCDDIILPVYQSPEGVRRAAAWFDRLLNEATDQPQNIIVVTTGREGVDSDTWRAAEVWASHNDAVTHLHSTRRPYGKSNQLNDAVTWIQKHHANWRSRFVTVYDIDGCPERFIRVQLGDEIVQQLAVPILAHRDGDTSWTRSYAAIQSWRVFVLEYSAAELFSSGCQYLWGNGLCIRLDILATLGGFPPENDDLELGYEASLSGHRLRVTPDVVAHEVYRDAADQVRSLTAIMRSTYPVGSRRWQRFPEGRGAIARATVAAHTETIFVLTELALLIFCRQPGTKILAALLAAREVAAALGGRRLWITACGQLPVEGAAREPDRVSVAAAAIPVKLLRAGIKSTQDLKRVHERLFSRQH